MMVEEDCGAVDRQKRRPWYRLHRSTAVVLLLVSGAMVLVNVPGHRRVTKFRPFHRYLTIDEEFHHGWPLVYLRRECVWPIFVRSHWPFWSLRPTTGRESGQDDNRKKGAAQRLGIVLSEAAAGELPALLGQAPAGSRVRRLSHMFVSGLVGVRLR